MKRRMMQGMLGAGLLLMTASGVFAQNWGPRDRDDYGYGERRGSDLFDRVRRDLDWAQSHAYGRSGDRFDHARKELWDFQRAWQRGRFDKHELDEAIGAVQSVVDHTPLPGRDMRVLQDDLAAMRNFRYEVGRHRGW